MQRFLSCYGIYWYFGRSFSRFSSEFAFHTWGCPIRFRSNIKCFHFCAQLELFQLRNAKQPSCPILCCYTAYNGPIAPYTVMITSAQPQQFVFEWWMVVKYHITIIAWNLSFNRLLKIAEYPATKLRSLRWANRMCIWETVEEWAPKRKMYVKIGLTSCEILLLVLEWFRRVVFAFGTPV